MLETVQTTAETLLQNSGRVPARLQSQGATCRTVAAAGQTSPEPSRRRCHHRLGLVEGVGAATTGHSILVCRSEKGKLVTQTKRIRCLSEGARLGSGYGTWKLTPVVGEHFQLSQVVYATAQEMVPSIEWGKCFDCLVQILSSTLDAIRHRSRTDCGIINRNKKTSENGQRCIEGCKTSISKAFERPKRLDGFLRNGCNQAQSHTRMYGRYMYLP